MSEKQIVEGGLTLIQAPENPVRLWKLVEGRGGGRRQFHPGTQGHAIVGAREDRVEVSEWLSGSVSAFGTGSDPGVLGLSPVSDPHREPACPSA